MNEVRFIDLFSGIGGFRRGLEKANRSFDVEAWRGQGMGGSGERGEPFVEGGGGRTQQGSCPHYRCVWSCDNDKYANQVYAKQFGEANHHPGDIKGVDPRDIPDFDLLCAGFPCQAFSVAGKRKGFQDTRGTLFFEICRIAEAKRPSLLLLENVKGLLSHDGGRTFTVILQSLDELGYWVEWQVLNSKHFGAPQNRERVFIIGHLRGRGGQEVFPITEDDKTTNETEREESSDNSHTITKGYSQMNTRGSYIQPVLTPDRINKRQHGRRFKENGDPSFTLTSQDIHGIAYPEIANTVCDGWLMDTSHHDKPMNHYRIRRLIPVECERLQGFPDGWTEGVSDTQRYKCLGNAVTVNVVEFLGCEILKSLEASDV